MESEGEYTLDIKNICPGQVWYRVYDDNSYRGREIPRFNIDSFNTPKKFKYLRGLLWENEQPEVWNPSFESKLEEESKHHRITITPLFGPRTTCSIKVLIASLAGPADPTYRNDTILVQKFKDFGVPAENIHLMLEKQCTPKTLTTNLENTLEFCNEGDILFLYIGGHGINSKGYYELCTHGGYTSSKMILKSLKSAKCEVFLVVDSCYSGQMIEDIKYNNFTLPKDFHILASTNPDLCAMTGWRLLQLLIDNIFIPNTYTNPIEVCNTIQEKLVTPLQGQRANVMIKRSGA